MITDTLFGISPYIFWSLANVFHHKIKLSQIAPNKWRNRTNLPLLVITISVPSLWNFSQSSFPSSVTFGSSTTPSSSGWSARNGRIGWSWWAATDARTTSSAVVYGVPSCKCGWWWCGGSFGNNAPGYKCGWWPPGELAKAARAAAWKYGWCGWLNGFGFGCGLHAEFDAVYHTEQTKERSMP